MKKQTSNAFVFVGPTIDDEILYWSNETGWGDKESATVFYGENIISPLETTGREYLNKVTSDV